MYHVCICVVCVRCVVGLTTRQPLRVLCRLPKKWREEIEEMVVEMKETDREERGTGMKVKKQKKYKHSPSTLTCYKNSRPCPTVSQYQLDALVTQDTRFLCHTQSPMFVYVCIYELIYRIDQLQPVSDTKIHYSVNSFVDC